MSYQLSSTALLAFIVVASQNVFAANADFGVPARSPYVDPAVCKDVGSAKAKINESIQQMEQMRSAYIQGKEKRADFFKNFGQISGAAEKAQTLRTLAQNGREGGAFKKFYLKIADDLVNTNRQLHQGATIAEDAATVIDNQQFISGMDEAKRKMQESAQDLESLGADPRPAVFESVCSTVVSNVNEAAKAGVYSSKVYEIGGMYFDNLADFNPAQWVVRSNSNVSVIPKELSVASADTCPQYKLEEAFVIDLDPANHPNFGPALTMTQDWKVLLMLLDGTKSGGKTAKFECPRSKLLKPVDFNYVASENRVIIPFTKDHLNLVSGGYYARPTVELSAVYDALRKAAE